MTRATRLSAGAVLVVLTVFCAAISASVSAAQDSPAFPAPVVAPVDPVDADLRVAVVAFYGGDESTPQQPVMVVRLAGNATALPSGSRVSVLTGDPAGEQARTSMVFIDGQPTGVIETSVDGQTWENQAEIQAALTDDGAISLPLPESQVSGSGWIDVETPDGARFTTGAYPLPVVLGFGEPGVLTTATLASEQGAAGNNSVTSATIDSVPELQLINEGITVSAAAPPPTEVGGVGVTQVVDSVRIAPDYRSSTRVPFFVTIDQASGDVQLWETHEGLPAPAAIPASTFVTTPLTTDEQGSTITLDQARLLEAVGLSADDDEVALGLTRTVILDDGRQLVSEGPVGTVAWFDAAAQPNPATDGPDDTATTAEVRVAESSPADEDSGPSAAVLIAAAVLVLVLIGAAVWSARRSRRARVDATTLDAMGKVVKPGADDSRSGSGAGVGVAGVRAAVTRKAREQAEQEATPEPAPSTDEAEETLAAVYAAMRRKASEAERPGAAGADGEKTGAETDVDDEKSRLEPREAAETEQTEVPSGDGSDAAESAPGTAAPAEADAGVAEPAGEKATRPDEALDALNRLIDGLD